MTVFNLVLVLCVVAVSTLVAGSSSRPSPRMCMIHCQYGFRRDTNGQMTCVCKKNPCDDEEAPLEGYFCGLSPNGRECPSTHQCKIAPNDAYAVCCPRSQKPTKPNPNKPGSCPSSSSSGLMGICIARCTDDSECEGEQKCCGGCPRQCTKPVFV